MYLPNLLVQQMADDHKIALFVKDASGRYSYANLAGAEILNTDVTTIVGQDDFVIFKRPSAEFIVDRDDSIKQKPRPHFYDAVAETQQGWRLYYSAKLRVRDGSSDKFGLIGLSADITKGRSKDATEVIRKLMAQLVREQRPTLLA